jgi:tetratricopeptide (TPR) repeat protein
MLRLVSSLLVLLLLTAPAWAVKKGDVVVIQDDAPLKVSGQVVGSVNAGDVLRVHAVRGAWVEVGEETRGWVRLTNVSSQQDALDRFSKLISERPADASLRLTRGQMFLSSDKLAAAEADFTAALDAEPMNAEAHYYLALLALKRKNSREALSRLDKAIELRDSDPRFFVERGRLRQEKNDIPGATEDFERVIELEAADALLYNLVAWWYATHPDGARRDAKKAVEYATKACELTHFDNWAFVDTLAAAYAEDGDFTNAVKYQEMAIRLCSDRYSRKYELEQRLKKYLLNEPYREEPR